MLIANKYFHRIKEIFAVSKKYFWSSKNVVGLEKSLCAYRILTRD
jgi:hypothetical protein